MKREMAARAIKSNCNVAVLSDVGISTRSVPSEDLIVIAPIDIGIADSCFNAELVCGGVGEV
jgi:hypothetical protein